MKFRQRENSKILSNAPLLNGGFLKVYNTNNGEWMFLYVLVVDIKEILKLFNNTHKYSDQKKVSVVEQF